MFDKKERDKSEDFITFFLHRAMSVLLIRMYGTCEVFLTHLIVFADMLTVECGLHKLFVA